MIDYISDDDSGSDGDPEGNDESDDSDNESDDGGFDNFPVFPGADNLDARATGDFSNNDRFDRASGTSASLACSENGEASQEKDFIGGILNQNRSDQLSDRYSPTKLEGQPQLLSDNAVAPTERASNWTGADLGDPLGGYGEALQAIHDFAAGVRDFVNNYCEMRDANVVGADRYFHCMANCEATERGPGGEAAAILIGYGREALDLPKNVFVKNLSFKESVEDGRGDLEANRIGRDGALSGIRCNNACQPLRPRGL